MTTMPTPMLGDAEAATQAATGAPPAQNTQTPAGANAQTADALYGKQAAQQSAAKNDATQDGADAPPDGPPEKYEFKAPEGRAFDAETIEAYSSVAREIGLSQESAQKVLDAMGPKMQARAEAQIAGIRTEWHKLSTADKEFGGENLANNLAVAKKALDAYGTPELRSLLRDSGLGSHPEIIRVLYRAGRAISEDSIVVNSQGQAKTGPRTFNDYAEALYAGQSQSHS